MISTIANVMKSSLVEDVRRSRYVSVMIDGDTDSSNKECEMVYVRIIQDGKPTNRLVEQQEVENAHALGVLQATKRAFEELGETGWTERLVGFGADGAAVNMGHRGGVIALLKEELGNHVIAFHCMPHRLELAMLTVQKNEPWVGRLYDLLNLLWKTYHYSPKAQRELKAVAEMLGVNVCNNSSVKGTRWIPHVQRALHVLLKDNGGKEEDSGQYAATLQHMSHLAASSPSSEIKGRANKVKTAMESAQFCAFSHFMADIFTVLGSLSKSLQANDLILPKATAELKRTVSELEGMKLRSKPGGMLERFLSMQSEGESLTFQGMELKGQLSLTDGVFSNPHVAAVVDIVVEEMRSRFSCILSQSGEEVVNCFKIFNHDAWPDSQGDLLDYGRAEVQSLLQHFDTLLRNRGCKLDRVQEEWQQLKAIIRTTFADKSYVSLWQTLLTKEPYCSEFENVLHLAEILLVLPISSAQCERGFSAQNRIKDSTRSCLLVSTTDNLVRISTEGCELEEFDPTEAAAKWMSSSKRARRPFTKQWPADNPL